MKHKRIVLYTHSQMQTPKEFLFNKKKTPNEFISQMPANIIILKFKYFISTVPISTTE